MEEWEPQIFNALDTLAREVYESPEESYDTGILDASGNPIVNEYVRNPIGFRAEIEE